MRYILSKRFTFTLLLPIMMASCSPSVHVAKTAKKSNLSVTTAMYRGTIFTREYPGAMAHLDVDSTRRFTPGKSEIQQAEKILRMQIKALNKTRADQPDGNPVIHQNLNCYYRQYVGIITPSGERLIHVNLYWDKYSRRNQVKGMKDNRLKFEDEYALTEDGGSHYWKVNVNLSKEELTDFQVNRSTTASTQPNSLQTAALSTRPD